MRIHLLDHAPLATRSAATAAMKITSVETFRCRVDCCNWLFVRVSTHLVDAITAGAVKG